MPISIVVPQLGESVAEGTVARWLKAQGDRVRKEEPLVEIQTDKINVEIPSPAEGTLTQILVGELALLRGRITLVDRSSMEIRVEVESENLLSGERRHTSTAFVTFVALDPATRRPTPVPPLLFDNDEERAEHARAVERRRLRLERRKAASRDV